MTDPISVENDYTPGTNQYDIIELLNSNENEDTNSYDSFFDFDLTDDSSQCEQEEQNENPPRKSFFDELLKELEENAETDTEHEEDPSVNDALSENNDDEQFENDVWCMLEHIVCSDFSMSKNIAVQKARAFLEVVEFTEDQHMIRVWHTVVDELYQCSEEEYEELKKSFDRN